MTSPRANPAPDYHTWHVALVFHWTLQSCKKKKKVDTIFKPRSHSLLYYSQYKNKLPDLSKCNWLMSVSKRLDKDFRWRPEVVKRALGRETLCEYTQGVMPGLDQKGVCIYFISKALESIERIQLGLMESQSDGE